MGLIIAVDIRHEDRSLSLLVGCQMSTLCFVHYNSVYVMVFDCSPVCWQSAGWEVKSILTIKLGPGSPVADGENVAEF